MKNECDYVQLTDDIQLKPVFIIGLHRTGTTMLCEFLRWTGLFDSVTAHHILNRDRLLHLRMSGTEQLARAELVQRFENLGITDRKFDRIRVSPDVSEEYCFALPGKPRRPRVTPRNLEAFKAFCRKVSFVQSGKKPLLLKNPFDADNFLFLAQSFPEARFVFIHREPLEQIGSLVRGLKANLMERNEYEALLMVRYGELFHQPLRWWLARNLYCREGSRLLVWQASRYSAAVLRYITERADEIADRSCHLTYGMLCESPNAVMSRLVANLGFPEAALPDYTHRIDRRTSELSADVAWRAKWIERHTEPYRHKFGI